MTIRNKWVQLFQPKSQHDDQRRQEIILNTLIWFSISAFLIINIVRTIDIVSNPADRGLPLIYTMAILGFFLFLLWLSRRGSIRPAAWLLTGAYALPMAYSFLTWGADLPAALLMSVLVITMFGVLIGAKFALISAALINAALLALTWLQSKRIWSVNSYWRHESHEVPDAIAYSVLIIVSAAIASLFAKEIERALKRARRSERTLRQERDQLEQRVAQKAEKLRQANAEKLTQLYRLAALGRLSSGIFHDLVNPLTAVSLNLEIVKDSPGVNLEKVQSHLRQAIMATRKIEGLVVGIKKQINQNGQTTTCSVTEEIRDAVEILAYKARQAGVTIKSEVEAGVSLSGNPVKLNQVIMNLLSNAIEASAGLNHHTRENVVLIKASTYQDKIEIRVSDSGRGISPTDLPHIFEPFFSTKKSGPGPTSNLGLGLSSVKETVDQYFNGQITVCSQEGYGTEFRVLLSKINNLPHEEKIEV